MKDLSARRDHPIDSWLDIQSSVRGNGTMTPSATPTAFRGNAEERKDRDSRQVQGLDIPAGTVTSAGVAYHAVQDWDYSGRTIRKHQRR